MIINYTELEEIGFFNYVAKYGYDMSKCQLIGFVKEISIAAEMYCINEYGKSVGKSQYKDYIESVAIEELINQEA